jgi:hypothetical protein
VQDPKLTAIAPTTPIAYNPIRDSRFDENDTTIKGITVAIINGKIGTPNCLIC